MTRADGGAGKGRPAPRHAASPSATRKAPAKPAAAKKTAPKKAAAGKAAPAKATAARRTSKEEKVNAKAWAKASAPRSSAPGRTRVAAKATTSTKAKAKPAQTGAPTRRKARTARAHGRSLAVVLFTISLAAFLLIAYFPTRTYLAQRRDTQAAAQQLAELEARNASLDQRAERLQTKDEIERIARSEYGLVRPGEESYAILPTPPPPVKLPDVWPFVGLADTLNK